MQPQPPAKLAEDVAAFLQGHSTGLLTLVFTDIVDSVRLKRNCGDALAAALLGQHHQLLRHLLAQFKDAREIETAGDSFFLVFASASEAVRFALRLQAELRDLASRTGHALQDRVGIHAGEVFVPSTGAIDAVWGVQIDTCARVMALARGGQILATRFVFDNARQVLKGQDLEGLGEVRWLNYGLYLFKGLEEPLEVCEIGEADQAPLTSPPATEKAQRYSSPLEEPVLGWRPAVGQRVPNTNWILEEKLGEGGFGEVWKARHGTLNQQRVFKFCFRADRVRSLKREVTLFRLLKERSGEHPNIVKLYDIDFDEPPYYLEEEYVAGKDLRSWCEAQGGVEKVSLELRLEIVAQAAEGLQAAHDAGIIHRDVKPGNILISAAVPEQRQASAEPTFTGRGPLGGTQSPQVPLTKLTDFGIGQVISSDYLEGVTRAGFTQTMLGKESPATGTTMYLAPELVAGMPASIRSDIYSLGVVLYQLLISDFRHPVTADWARDIREPLLREDLEHCFAWNPEQRFAGAAQLAQNLRALPARQAARAQQQAERAALERRAYRRGVVRAAAISLVIVLVVGALAAAAVHQSRRARSQAATAQRVSDFLVELFRVSDPGEARGNSITAREILDRGAKRIEQDLTHEPLVQAKLMDTMGRVYRNLGLQSQAQPLLERALRQRRELLGEEHLDYAESLTSLANLLWDKGDYSSAKPLFERALAIREKALGPDDLQVASGCHNLANLLLLQGDYVPARGYFERALKIREKELGPMHAEVGATLNSLGALEYRVGNPARARSFWERSLAVREQTLGTNHYLVAMSCNNLGLLRKDMGDLAEAKALLQRALAIQEKVLGTNHADLAAGLHNFGDLLRKTGEAEAARAVLQRAIQIREAAFGPDHPELARATFSLAELERENGHYAAARPLYERALAIHQKAPQEHAESGWYIAGLANLARDEGNLAEAEAIYGRALQEFDKVKGLETPAVAEVYRHMGQLYQTWGRSTQAEQFYQHTLTIYQQAYGSNHPDIKELRQRIAQVRMGPTNATATPQPGN